MTGGENGGGIGARAAAIWQRPVRDSQVDQDERTVQRLRLGIGVIGVLLPIVLPLGNWIFVQLGHTTEILPGSLSGSYYTSTRNIFVGSLCALGVFLIGYRYDRRDDVWSTTAGVFAIGVALFPTAPTKAPTGEQSTIGVFHLIFAGVLLSALAMFCLRSFRNPAAADRRTANLAYLIAGVLIFFFLAVAVVAGVTHWGHDWTLTPLYVCESLSVWAFGAAWLGAAVELGALARARGLLMGLVRPARA